MPGPQPPSAPPPSPPAGGKATPRPKRTEVQRRLIDDHIPFVRSIARKLREQVPMVEFDDLVGFGMQGLIEAAERYDDRHGAAFTTFAYYRVRGAMFDGLRAMGWLPRSEYHRVRVEDRASNFMQNMASRNAADQQDSTREAGTDENVEGQVRHIAEALHGVATIFVTLLGRQEEQQLQDERAAPHEQLERRQLGEQVRRAMRRLPDKERRLIEMYYFHDQTLEQVGISMGLSKSWTSRLHARAIALLREALHGD